MESNKEDAARCRRIASEAISQRDFEKAIRFVNKAKKLYPNEEIDKLIAEAERLRNAAVDESEAEPPFSSQSKDPFDTQETTRFRSRADDTISDARPEQSTSSGSFEASEEQIALVKRIISAKSYYEVLEVTKSCTDDEIKKAYRKLSLKVHPDKNKCRGAEEAFKAISKAFQCLTDKTLRENYDTYGHEDPSHPSLSRNAFNRGHRDREGGGSGFHASQFRNGRYSRVYFDDDDFDPNEIFNAFFGLHNPNGHPFGNRFHVPRRVPRAPPQANRNRPAHPPSFLFVLQFLPFLFLFLFSFLPGHAPLYSLEKSETHELERETSRYSVKYFVQNSQFDITYPPRSRKRSQLERDVENTYVERLQNLCYSEKRQQANYAYFNGWQQAKELELPHCSLLQNFQARVQVYHQAAAKA